MAFAALTIDLNARLAKFEQDMARAGKSLDGLNNRAGALAAGFKAAFGGLAAGLSVGALASFAKSGIDAADSLNDMSQRLGVSVKDLASFKLAAEQSGTSLDGVGAGIARLSKSIGEAEGGNKKLAQALQTLGVTARDPKEAFFQLADAVQRIQDPAQRAALLSQVLGKSYGELVPLLAQGGDELRKSAQASESFATQMAKLAPNADAFNDQIAELQQNAAGFAASVLNAVVPALNQFAERIERIQRLRTSGASLFEIATGGVSADTGASLQRVNADIKDIESSIDRLRKNSGGRDSSIATLTADLERLKGVRAELRRQSMEGALALADKYGNYKQPGPPAPKAATTDFSKALGGGGSKGGSRSSDPLASLLASTDIGKLKDFDKHVALLNARFAFGRKDADLYAQAMTKLVESTFADSFRQHADAMREEAETQRMVADHLRETEEAIRAQDQAWRDAGAALEDEMRTPLENANIEFGRLQELLDRGVISWETYTRAVLKTQDAIEEVPDKLGEMDVFAKKAAENIQDAFSDFLFDPFDKGLDGMLKSFGQTIQRMIADAAAADLNKWLFGDLVKGGEGSGVAGSLLSKVGSIFDSGAGNGQNLLGDFASLFGFANGGSFAVGGSGGTDSQLVAFRATPGEMVDVRTPAQARSGGGHTINVYIDGSNGAPGVRNAAGQVARSVMSALEGGRRYG